MNFFRKLPERESSQLAIGDDIIEFSVFRSRKRKRTIAFKMERDSHLRVLAPASASLGSLTKILRQRASWIIQQLAERKDIAPQNDFTDGTGFSYLGHRYILRVTQGGTNAALQSCRLSPRFIHIYVPDENLSPENLRQEVRLEIILWLKKRARVKLKKRCDLWAARMGVDYKKLMVTNPHGRWGSCSSDNVIRLNWRLMLVPLAIVDYVVVHELAHIPHKNHGPRFWAFVGRFMPDYLARRKYLRKIEHTLTL
jgi:predicted metal-dependent hydrolase